jgi:hypothetical protein
MVDAAAASARSGLRFMVCLEIARPLQRIEKTQAVARGKRTSPHPFP